MQDLLFIIVEFVSETSDSNSENYNYLYLWSSFVLFVRCIDKLF